MDCLPSVSEVGTNDAKLVVLRLPPSTKCLGKAPSFETGNLRTTISPGLHLGSSCPVNPEETAIYDFLPSNLIGKTVNLAEFAKVLVVDMFLGQADSRQAVFVRDRSKRELSFRAYFIDHGFAFGGNKWKIDDFARQALYFDQNVYSMIHMGSLCEQAIESLASVSEDELRNLARGIPSEWLGPTDDENLCSLFTTLQKRRVRMRTLISELLIFLSRNTLHEPTTYPRLHVELGTLQTLNLGTC